MQHADETNKGDQLDGTPCSSISIPPSVTFFSASENSRTERRFENSSRHDDPAWQGRRESNSQPPVLETGALPIELRPCKRTTQSRTSYSIILVTTPAPTVRPPSRMAKRRFSFMAIGLPKDPVIVTLSPGITISTPSGRFNSPVTSVVRK